MPVGSIVRSICGRDRYRPFAVVGVTDDGRLLVADGNLHKLSSPKKKNLRHVEILAVSRLEQTSLSLMDDAKLFQMLREIEIEIANKKV